MSKRSDSTVGADWQPVLPKITDEELMKRMHESDEQEEEIREPTKESGGESFFYRYRLPIAIIVILIICIVIYVYMTRQSEPAESEVPPAALLNAQARARTLSRAPPGPPEGIDRDELARLREMRRQQRSQQRSQVQEREEESSDGEVEEVFEGETPTAIAPTAMAPTGPRVTFKQPLEAPPAVKREPIGEPTAPLAAARANTGESITDLISQTQSRPATPGVTAAQLRTMRAQAPMQAQAPVRAQAPMQAQAPVRAQAPMQSQARTPIQAQAPMQSQARTPMQVQAPLQSQAAMQAAMQAQVPAPALMHQSPPRARPEMPTQLSMMHPLNAVEEAVPPAQDDEMDDLINSLGDAPQ